MDKKSHTKDWKEIYTIPFKYTREPYLQSLQYKTINIILNTNETLAKWCVKLSNKSSFCKAINTLEHHLYQCKKVKLSVTNCDYKLFIMPHIVLIYEANYYK